MCSKRAKPALPAGVNVAMGREELAFLKKFPDSRSHLSHSAMALHFCATFLQLCWQTGLQHSTVLRRIFTLIRVMWDPKSSEI